MFTGIIEEVGLVSDLTADGDNVHLKIKAAFAQELKVDQSVAHDGVCLTVTEVNGTHYGVTAIKETLTKTNLETLRIGSKLNLERGMKLGERLDGHIVQGHVDQVGICTEVKKENGSHVFTFDYDPDSGNLTIEKGSITVNGVSLTVVDSGSRQFSVAIIPYTFDHTTFRYLKKGDRVNLEFDVIGKYVQRLMNP